ncbi:MAG TPA: portal protein [Smithellaceae bacterium]|nr:portal protein [Smithellaceae bacterium]
MADHKPEKIVEIYDLLDQDKSTLKSHLQEIADYMIPRRQGVTTTLTAGGKRMSKIYDGTAIRALRVFANGLYGHLTSPAYPWFELTTKDRELGNVPAVKFWLADTTEKLRSAINTSNAPLALHEVYTDLGWAGTGCLYIEPGKKYKLNFMSFGISQTCIMEDANGVVDTVYRLTRMTARQCVQYWGDKCSPKIQKALEQGKHNEKFEIIHAVYPRDDYDWTKRDAKNMPWVSQWVEKDTKNELSRGGYAEFPYCVPRWEKDNDETYGRSCGMDALPDTKMLNQMCYDDIRAIQKRIDPPITASTEAGLSTTRTSAGSIIFHKKGEKPEPMLLGGDIRLAFEAEEQKRQQIQQAFYVDLFLLLAQAKDPNRTATEVRELIEEKMTLLGPALSRLQTELFDPMLGRCFSILLKNGEFLPPPEELAGQSLEIEYIGRLALAMKETETRAAMSTLSAVGGMAQFDPEVMDNFDTDEIAVGTAQRKGMPVKYIRPPQVRDEIRQRRAEQMAQQRQAEELLEAGKVMPGLTKAPEQGSPAEALMGK